MIESLAKLGASANFRKIKKLLGESKDETARTEGKLRADTFTSHMETKISERWHPEIAGFGVTEEIQTAIHKALLKAPRTRLPG